MSSESCAHSPYMYTDARNVDVENSSECSAPSRDALTSEACMQLPLRCILSGLAFALQLLCFWHWNGRSWGSRLGRGCVAGDVTAAIQCGRSWCRSSWCAWTGVCHRDGQRAFQLATCLAVFYLHHRQIHHHAEAQPQAPTQCKAAPSDILRKLVD